MAKRLIAYNPLGSDWCRPSVRKIFAGGV